MTEIKLAYWSKSVKKLRKILHCKTMLSKMKMAEKLFFKFVHMEISEQKIYHLFILYTTGRLPTLKFNKETHKNKKQTESHDFCEYSRLDIENPRFSSDIFYDQTPEYRSFSQQ